MMTYMLREKYGASHADLDNARLHALLEDCMLIFDDLTGVTPYKNQNHPSLGMWRGYEFALGIYAMMGNLVWTFNKGFADQKYMKFFYAAIKEMQGDDPGFQYEMPPWWGDTDILLSHRSYLRSIDRGEYGSKWKNCPRDWPMIWPRLDDGHPDGYTLWFGRGDKELVLKGLLTLPEEETLSRIVNWP
jgi:hypothetical protein